MLPTLQDGNRIIVSKLTEIDRFDEIVFKAPDREVNHVKRVIGLPGDKVEIRAAVLYINGEPYEEPYLNGSKEAAMPDERVAGNYDFTLAELTDYETVPEGELFVMGDNRLKSRDSRRYGFIKEESVIGEVKLRLWPFDQIGQP